MEILGMYISLPIIWLIVAAIFAIIEIITLGITSIWFTGGALIAALVALLTDAVLWQILTFLVVSILLIILTKPIVKKHMNDKTKLTNMDYIIGKQAIVTKEITETEKGEVKFGGNIWLASTKCDRIEVDTKVVIKAIEGVTLIVDRKEV